MAKPCFHQRDHIRHGNIEPHIAIRRFLGSRELIQVARIIIVNRRPQHAPQVTNLRGAFSGFNPSSSMSLKAGKLGECGRGEIRQQSTLKHRLMGDTLQNGMVVPAIGSH